MRFGRYDLIRKIGQGGMSEVFLAAPVSDPGERVVIKRMRPSLADDERFVALFQEEAKITAHMRHPNVVRVLEAGEVYGQLFIAMEFVDGVDCWRLVNGFESAGRRPLPARAACFIIRESLLGLAHVHEAVDAEGHPMGVVHGDVSPTNIYVSRSGEVKLGDFGIARRKHRELSPGKGPMTGKVAYLAPEQVLGLPFDHHADLFAAGTVLAELLIQDRLFASKSHLTTLLAIRDVRLDPLEQHGHKLAKGMPAYLRRALAKAPVGRFSSASEMADALVPFLDATDDETLRRELADLVGLVAGAAAPEEPGRGGDAETPDDERETNPVPSLGTATGGGHPDAEDDEHERITARPEVLEGAVADSADPREAGEPDRDRFSVRPEDLDWDSEPIDVLIEPSLPPEARPTPVAQAHVLDDARPSGPPPAAPVWGGDEGAALDDWSDLVDSGEAELDIDIDIEERTERVSRTPRPVAEPADLNPFGEFSEATPKTPVGPVALVTFRCLDGKVLGPMHFPAAIDKVMAGEVGPDDLVSVDDAEPRPLAEFEELARFAPAPTPTASQSFAAAPPDRKVLLLDEPVARIFATLAVAKETGLAVFEHGPIRKDVYFVDGNPTHVSSNMASELLGEHLVRKGVVSRMELEMAFALLPKFDNHLGDTLVGLGLVEAVTLFRHISEQVRGKLLELFAWTRGELRYYRGVGCPQPTFPLGILTMSLLWDGVASALPPEDALAWLSGLERRSMRKGSSPAVRRQQLGLPPAADKAVELAARTGAVRTLVVRVTGGNDSLRAELAQGLRLALDLGILDLVPEGS